MENLEFAGTENMLKPLALNMRADEQAMQSSENMVITGESYLLA